MSREEPEGGLKCFCVEDEGGVGFWPLNGSLTDEAVMGALLPKGEMFPSEEAPEGEEEEKALEVKPPTLGEAAALVATVARRDCRVLLEVLFEKGSS